MSTSPDAFAAPLQFDAVEPVQAQATAAITCASCHVELRSMYHQVNGKVACSQCRAKVEAQVAAALAAPGGMGRAILFGLGGSVAGGALYYGMTLTGWLIGPVAVLVGFAVAAAVRKGAGGRAGRNYQIAALALTYLALSLAYLPYAIQGMPETAPPLAMVIGGLLVLLKLPVIVATSDPLSVLFMGIGCYQAWKVAGQPAEGVMAVAPTITGPHRIAQPAEA
jgi:hypothetical protein